MFENKEEKIYKTSCFVDKPNKAALEQRIMDFLQGAVYQYCLQKGSELFSLSSLVGGGNANWVGTPLQSIHDYHVRCGKTATKAYTTSAIDAGRLLKKVLYLDGRCFKIERGRSNQYRWVVP